MSNWAAWQIAKALGICPREGWAGFEVLQPMYNLTKRQAEVELLPLALDARLGVIPYSPLGGGLLTGKYGVQARPDAGGSWKTPRLRFPDLQRVVLHPAGLGKDLSELLLRRGADGARMIENDGARTGRALVQGEDGGWHGHKFLNWAIMGQVVFFFIFLSLRARA